MLKNEVVINPLSWRRKEVVVLPTEPEKSPEQKKLKKDSITQMTSNFKLLGKLTIVSFPDISKTLSFTRCDVWEPNDVVLNESLDPHAIKSPIKSYDFIQVLWKPQHLDAHY